ncbi:DUF805 domain-containing protein [Novosphingobium sp.]|uniref:DUF805 domain-containing protein n=1 Tax=Novosphingobium sp. TaxID=1874826 RepID=UPI0025DD5634|nr:DUF805 domain-containing protein [Novosphingobium sp.]
MSFSVQDKSRLGRSGYWTAFVINIVAIIGLLGACIAAALGGHISIAVLLFLLVAPVGIYFRVIMMRRCRDIGWPAALPWILFGAGILATLTRFSQGLEGLRSPGLGGVAGLVSLIDFGFMIAIGCIQGQSRSGSYAQYFEPDDDDYSAVRPANRAATAQPARMPQGYEPEVAPAASLSREDEEAGWDAAIARALAARQDLAADDERNPVAPAVHRPVHGIQRPAGGFGRRVV